MPALRILHVTPYYEDAWAYGGIPRVATTLARGLVQRGHRVTVCTTDACDRATRLARGGKARHVRAPWPGVRATGGVELQIFPNASNRLAYHAQLFVPLGLDAYLRAEARAFDVAHVHGCHHLPGVLAAHRLRAVGVPYVLAPNGTAPRIERRRLGKYLFDATVARDVIPGASRIMAVSEAERRQLEALGLDPATIAVVPNPVDLAEFAVPPDRGRFRRRVGIPSGRLVLYLGTLTPRKRVDLLVAAFAALRRPDTRLVIAGNDLGAGPRLGRLVREAGLAGVTTFAGLLRGPARLEALADADVVAYPSEHEVFGLVALEALLAGTPVVVADDSGCGDMIAETGGGLVVQRGDPIALAVAIARILDGREDWRGAVAGAQARVRQRYSAETVCGRLEDLYREITAAAGRDQVGAERG